MIMSNEYLERLFDKELDFELQVMGGVLIVGPKWCGKTSTAKRHAASVIDMLDPEEGPQNLAFAKAALHQFLTSGKAPMLIDEWQVAPFIWNGLKGEIDRQGEAGLYILTGSVSDATAYNEGTNERHTGNGRIVTKMMRTMSLFESKESNGLVSIADLKDGKFTPCTSDKTIDDYGFYICRGGWPGSIGKEPSIALKMAENYVNVLAHEDIFSLNDIRIRKDYETANRFLRSYARNIGTQVSNQTIISDMGEGFGDETFARYFAALQRLYVIDEVRAWNPNLRSKTAIRTKNTRYFVDPSIPVSLMGLSPKALYKDMKYFGFLFESLAIRDLKVYAEANDASVYHYRDNRNREVDVVMVFKDGSYGLFEVKLGDESDIEEAAAHMTSLSKDFSVQPLFKSVITKGRFAYQRDDGVYVLPLACLRN